MLANDGQGKGIFKTTSGSYIIDDSTLSVGDQTNDPTILIRETVHRGKTTSSLQTYSSDPIGIVSFDNDSGVGIYYQTTYRGVKSWKRDVFNTDGVFQQTNNYIFSQVLDDEVNYNLDLNGDSFIGNTVNELLDDNGSIAIYKLVSGEYVIGNSGVSVGGLVDPIYLTQSGKNLTFKNKISGSLFTKTNHYRYLRFLVVDG